MKNQDLKLCSISFAFASGAWVVPLLLGILDSGGYPGTDLVLVLQTHHAVHLLAILHDHENGYGAHIVVQSQFAVLVYVHFGQFNGTGLLAHNALDAWRQQLAGITPSDEGINKKLNL